MCHYFHFRSGLQIVALPENPNSVTVQSVGEAHFNAKTSHCTQRLCLDSIMPSVYLVLHQNLPTYSMYLSRVPYSEPIETVNATVVGVYKTLAKAETAASECFFQTRGLTDSGESENGGYYYESSDDGGDCGTWDEEVYVQEEKVH
jgi:hypothetical protein